MVDTKLTAGEKSSLTEVARKLVERGARANAEPATSAGPVSTSDSFSEDGRLQRLLDLEKRLSDVSREWSRALNGVLFTVERLETGLARLEGEVQGLHESNDRLEEQTRLHAEDVSASATAFGEATAARLQAVLDRVETLVTGSRTSR